MTTTINRDVALERPSPASIARDMGRWVSRAIVVVPAALFAFGLVLRLAAIAVINFPLTEGSAYYIAVAHNIATGRGFEIDAIWSYATPPLTLPRPAFELWQPLASVIAAGPMAVLGPTFAAGQLAYVVLGAALGPLAWLLARDAATRMALPQRRVSTVALGAGSLAALSGPLLLSTAVPDSALPFTVLALAASLSVPRALHGRTRDVVALGVILGLAYLARMEAIYLGAAFVIVALGSGIASSQVIGRALGAASAAALVASPWWLRNLSVFGTPMPGQLADNAFLTNNEQIFAFTDRPSLSGFLDQGLPTIVGNIVSAAWHNLVNVLLVPGGVVAAAGLVTLVAVGLHRQRRRLSAGSPLVTLLVAGGLIYAVTTVVFPVATLWGTFEHAAGLLSVALIVVAVLGADAGVARIRSWRSWPRSNAWLAPVALFALTLPLAGLQLSAAGRAAATSQVTLATLAQTLPTVLETAGVDPRATLISDRPIWLADALGRPVIALPDEPPASVLRLAHAFNAAAVVVLDSRGVYPAALLDQAACFRSAGLAAPTNVSVFFIDEACR